MHDRTPLIVMGTFTIVCLTLIFLGLLFFGGGCCPTPKKLTIIQHPLVDLTKAVDRAMEDIKNDNDLEMPGDEYNRQPIVPKSITLKCRTCKWSDKDHYPPCRHEPNFRMLLLQIEAGGGHLMKSGHGDHHGGHGRH